ncbi:MAG TPA: 5-oxoprolinase subunit PxpB, partial [Longilinea sp.]|nr:5-oxoprolinase subunit PxpB [Longilinea sp.]
RLPGVGEAVPGYTTLMVKYDPQHLDYPRLCAEIQTLLEQLSEAAAQPPHRVEIPVAYWGRHGPDLDFVTRHTGLAPEEVIRRHVAGVYPVYFLGFLPGFPYLGGMDPALATPRLESPRTSVPAGSVGIAGAQTGIYPSESPGGWRLIGRTPLALFDPLSEKPALLSPGDEVVFVPLSTAEADYVA